LLELVDAAFDGVALLVGLAVEGSWPAAAAALAESVAALVSWDRDDGTDGAFAQVFTDGARGVGLMGGEGRRELTFVGASRAFEYARAWESC
jgi:hypothetical protein